MCLSVLILASICVGHVEYRSYEDVKEALRHLHDTELKGSYIKIYEVRKRTTHVDTVGAWVSNQ